MHFLCRTAVICLLASAASALPAAELKPWTGRQLPQFELRDIAARNHRLADYRGKVVLVNFWATWCEPCRDEMPSMDKLREMLSGRPFVVLAINVDEPESRVRKFLEKLPLGFPVLLDPGRGLTKAWNVRVLPASFVIGPDGRVSYAAVGELDWSAPAVAERISALFPAR